MKDLLGEAGRTYEVCQSTVELDAPNQQAAEMLAKQRFCESMRHTIGLCTRTGARWNRLIFLRR